MQTILLILSRTFRIPRASSQNNTKKVSPLAQVRKTTVSISKETLWCGKLILLPKWTIVKMWLSAFSVPRMSASVHGNENSLEVRCNKYMEFGHRDVLSVLAIDCYIHKYVWLTETNGMSRSDTSIPWATTKSKWLTQKSTSIAWRICSGS